jgi:hypothetical protein
MKRPRKPDPETAALLARARAGEWLTEAEKHQLLSFNHDYVFRFFYKGSDVSGHITKEQLSPDLEPEDVPWRMIGRTEPIVHEDEGLLLSVWKDSKGRGWYWGVMIDACAVVEGYEPTPEEAARRGGDAFAMELFKREPVDPPDYTAIENAKKKGEPPPCSVCGKPPQSFCPKCLHTFCGTTCCPKQPLATRDSCFFCDGLVVVELIKGAAE